MMKHRVFLLILVAVACTSQNRGPLVRYKSKVIELGTITFKNEFLGSIIIENFGDEPLVLLGATADCSCTIPEDIKNIKISPGDSTFVKFKLIPENSGYIQQSIFLDNTSKNEGRILFLIIAKVQLLDK
ncbi:MAG: DUF1573 domain-containing protein [Chitinophagaceae bacterium]|nr:DUF1573 domain-containing protein [Chitinophagaceae bacterium]